MGRARADGFYRAIMKFVLVILVAAPLFALAGAPPSLPQASSTWPPWQRCGRPRGPWLGGRGCPALPRSRALRSA